MKVSESLFDMLIRYIFIVLVVAGLHFVGLTGLKLATVILSQPLEF